MVKCTLLYLNFEGQTQYNSISQFLMIKVSRLGGLLHTSGLNMKVKKSIKWHYVFFLSILEANGDT